MKSKKYKEIVIADIIALFSKEEATLMVASVLSPKTVITEDFYKYPLLENAIETYCIDSEKMCDKEFLTSIYQKLSTLNDKERLALVFYLKYDFEKEIEKERWCFSGITNFMAAIIDKSLVVVLNSHKMEDSNYNYILEVPIRRKKLQIEGDSLSGMYDLYYLCDLIDTGPVYNLLNENKIDYLHICHTGEYRIIEDWDNYEMLMYG